LRFLSARLPGFPLVVAKMSSIRRQTVIAGL